MSFLLKGWKKLFFIFCVSKAVINFKKQKATQPINHDQEQKKTNSNFVRRFFSINFIKLFRVISPKNLRLPKNILFTFNFKPTYNEKFSDQTHNFHHIISDFTSFEDIFGGRG